MKRVDRDDLVNTVLAKIRAGRPEFLLVNPYQGELDRYRKIGQIEDPTFPAQVNMTTPFALVISKDRENKNDTDIRLRHNLSVYVGVENTHELASSVNPSAWNLLSLLVKTLREVDGLYLVNDGIYLCTTDQFTVYDQQWYRNELPNL